MGEIGGFIDLLFNIQHSIFQPKAGQPLADIIQFFII